MHRIADGDWNGLMRVGSVPGGSDLDWLVRNYGHIVALLPDVWTVATSERWSAALDIWSVDVPLWTAEEGQTDLEMRTIVREDAGQLTIEILDIHPKAVPDRFRRPLAEISRRVAAGDYDSLIRAEAEGDYWLQHGGRSTLVPPPPEAWPMAYCHVLRAEPGSCRIILPLWTAQGRSGFWLEATIRENEGKTAIEVDAIVLRYRSPAM